MHVNRRTTISTPNFSAMSIRPDQDQDLSKTCARFSVCTDVKVGPALPRQSVDDLRTNWARIPKNKDSGDSTKTQGDPRFLRFQRKSQSEAPVSSVEATGALEVGADRAIVFSDFVGQNLLARAVHEAFYKHYPLRLSPDVIWTTIVQGLAKHIDKDPEGQRANFVDFEGRKTITVERPEFFKGSPDNDWTSVFPEFADAVSSFVGKELVDKLSNDFTTSSAADQICANIALMDTVKHYFKYQMVCGCGIPSIELTGTAEDWASLRRKAEILDRFGLDWWTKELLPVLDHFVAAASGRPDVRFWKSVCNLYGASGFWMDYVTGWVQVFFPYVSCGYRNEALQQWRTNYEKGKGDETERLNRGEHPVTDFCDEVTGAGLGLKLDEIPGGLSQAPVTYVDLPSGRKYDMTFNGGIVAVLQHKESKALEPVNGWAVLDHGQLQSA